jgi:hypothetical protein
MNVSRCVAGIQLVEEAMQRRVVVRSASSPRRSRTLRMIFRLPSVNSGTHYAASVVVFSEIPFSGRGCCTGHGCFVNRSKDGDSSIVRWRWARVSRHTGPDGTFTWAVKRYAVSLASFRDESRKFPMEAAPRFRRCRGVRSLSDLQRTPSWLGGHRGATRAARRISSSRRAIYRENPRDVSARPAPATRFIHDVQGPTDLVDRHGQTPLAWRESFRGGTARSAAVARSTR